MPTRNSYITSLILLTFCCTLVSSQYGIPDALTRQMATRRMRYHHFLWHNVREGWNRFPDSTRQAFRNIGWAAPRAARTFDSDGSSSAIYDNDSGEDFLYMHRQMIATANDIIADNEPSYGRIQGWESVPGPDDSDYPVPGMYTDSPLSTSSLRRWKSDSFYTDSIRSAEINFKNPSQLRRWSLGELGARIEMSMHSWMHMRWSGRSSVGYRTGYRGTIPNVDRRWDDVNYDWLGDSYSSHVNPFFWKLHGWVNDRVEDWRRANGLSSIRWRGTWVGGPMENLSSVMKHSSLRVGHTMKEDDPNKVSDVMEQAFNILMESGVPEFTVADDAEQVLRRPASSPKATRFMKKACGTKVKKVL